MIISDKTTANNEDGSWSRLVVFKPGTLREDVQSWVEENMYTFHGRAGQPFASSPIISAAVNRWQVYQSGGLDI